MTKAGTTPAPAPDAAPDDMFAPYDAAKLPKPGKAPEPPDPKYLAAVQRTNADHPLSVKVQPPNSVKDIVGKLNRVGKHLGVTVSTRTVESDGTESVVFWQRPKITKKSGDATATATGTPTATPAS